MTKGGARAAGGCWLVFDASGEALATMVMESYVADAEVELGLRVN